MGTRTFDRIQAAFKTAASRTGRDRGCFIEQLHNSDPDLASEVRSLLLFHDSGNDPLEVEHASDAKACDATRRFESPLPAIHGYDVKRRLGAGGQADVFLARQESTGQLVAVKVFRGLGLADAQRSRIDAEAKALVRLQLPNVVAILDRGQTICGREFLVTRFVDGMPIDQAAAKLLAEGGPQEFAKLFAKVAETLARVHRAGIIHRDLKPSNIFVDGNGEPYLLDFGLASFFADPSGRLLTATPDNAFRGSILWASPEQVDASFGSVDHRSDIYSLGVVLYQSLSGKFPYPVDGGILEIAQQIVRTPPTNLVDLSATIPRWTPQVECVVLRALDKQPPRRFQSADEFATALRGLPDTVLQATRNAQTSSRPTRTRRFVFLGGAVIAGSMLWAGLNAATDAMSGGEAPVASRAVETFDQELAAFGVVPTHWKQVGSLRTDYHEIERPDLAIDGDFLLRLEVSADRATRAGFALSLIGGEGGDDLMISATKTNTWSDNESWELRTPAGAIATSLPVGLHTFVLKRQGELFTLAVDAVRQPNRSNNVLATFAASGSKRFRGIRLATGPAIQLERLRLHTSAGNSR